MTWAHDRINAGVDNSDYVIDYSDGLLSGEAIAREGYFGSKRYIDRPDLLSHKHTTPDEYKDHLANGLHTTLVMEVNTDDPLGGYNRGVQLAQRAVAGAEYIGYQGSVIAFCADRHFVTKNKPTITTQMWHDYLGGAESVVGPQSLEAYGFSEAMDCTAASYWQAGSASAVVDHADYWQDNTWGGFIGTTAIDRNLMKVKGKGLITVDEKTIAQGVWRTAVEDFTQPKNPDGTQPTMDAYLALARARQDAFQAYSKALSVETKVNSIQVSGVDLDLLADKVTDRILARLNLKQAL